MICLSDLRFRTVISKVLHQAHLLSVINASGARHEAGRLKLLLLFENQDSQDSQNEMNEGGGENSSIHSTLRHPVYKFADNSYVMEQKQQ